MRKHWSIAAIVVVFLQIGGVCAQQSYPTRPVRLIVPFAPGGGTDITARLLAQKLTESFRQTVIVDNRPGGGGTIGIETAVRANPGYTLILLTTGYTTNAALGRLPYDPVQDVSPIGLVGETGFVVALQPSLPVKSIKELIAYDKASPGKINYAPLALAGSRTLRQSS